MNAPDTPAMKPVMLPHLVLRDVLPDGEHAELLGWALDNATRFAPAQIRQGLNPDLRRALVLHDLGPLRPSIRDRIAALVPDWIAALKVSAFDVHDIEFELAAHNDGAHFTVHSDLYTGTPAARGDRMLSAVLYFHREPKAFSGGQLRLHALGGGATIDVPPLQNSLVVFPSWAPHEVTPIRCPSNDFADSRFAVNCWIYRAPR